MPLVASLIKIAALSLALLCVDIKPMSVPIETAGVVESRARAVPDLFRLPAVRPPGGRHANNERSSR